MQAESHSRPALVYPILAVGVLTFSLSPILVRLAGEAPGLAVAAWRTFFAVVLLAPVAMRYRDPASRKLSRRERFFVVLSGVFLAGHFVLWIESLYLTTVASASILVASSPILLAVLSFVFLRERLTWPVVLAIVCGVAGAVIMSAGDSASGASDARNPMLGNALAATATLLFSLYFLLGRVVRQKVDWLAYVFPVYLVVAVTTVTIAVVRGVPMFGYPPHIYLLCLGMAVGPQIIGHGAFSFGVRYFSATLLGLLGLTEPLGATFLAYLLFGEIPAATSLLGMSVVLVSVAVALLLSRRKPTVGSTPVRVD